MNPNLNEIVLRNMAEVRRRMNLACVRAGRSLDSVQLVAVTKYAPLEAIRALLSLSHHCLGENRPQQLIERAALFPEAQWHLIGHLQRNKVRSVLPHTCLVHSVDSLRLLQQISQTAGQLGGPARVLLEINVSGETAKDGFKPEQLFQDLPQLVALPHVVIEGLMTMAPLSDSPEHSRPCFRRLRELREELAAMYPQHAWLELSMGMSGDFEVAIEEGATLIRVGSSLFTGLEDVPE